jgi:hypothetical protein
VVVDFSCLVVFLSAADEFEVSANHRDTKNTEVAQREEKGKAYGSSPE